MNGEMMMDYSNYFYGTTGTRKTNTPVKKEYTKDKDAFLSGSGICYTDRDGNNYTRDDLISLLHGEIYADRFFESLDGETPQRTLTSSREFSQCPHCGFWIYREFSLSPYTQKAICPNCAPVRTAGRIELQEDDVFDDGRQFYKVKAVQFAPGLTTLCGCNGFGKTTLLNEIKTYLSKKSVPVACFDNVGQNGGQNYSRDMLNRSLSGLAAPEEMRDAILLMDSSEGEKIGVAVADFMRRAVQQSRNYQGKRGEFWVLIDALDSGLSVDVIDEIKESLFEALLQNMPEDMNIYIVVTSNSYEMSEGTHCMMCDSLIYEDISSYEKFRKLVKRTRLEKEKRDAVLTLMNEVRNLPHSFTGDPEEIDMICDRYWYRYDGKQTRRTALAEAQVGQYKLTVKKRIMRDDSDVTATLQKNTKTGNFRKIRTLNDDEIWDLFGRSAGNSATALQTSMYSYVERYIYLQEAHKTHTKRF